MVNGLQTSPPPNGTGNYRDRHNQSEKPRSNACAKCNQCAYESKDTEQRQNRRAASAWLSGRQSHGRNVSQGIRRAPDDYPCGSYRNQAVSVNCLLLGTAIPRNWWWCCGRRDLGWSFSLRCAALWTRRRLCADLFAAFTALDERHKLCPDGGTFLPYCQASNC